MIATGMVEANIAQSTVENIFLHLLLALTTTIPISSVSKPENCTEFRWLTGLERAKRVQKDCKSA